MFSDPHVNVGLVAGDGGAVMWPYLIGHSRAKRYLLTGDSFRGSEAAEIGLITEVVPDEDLDAVVEAMAGRLAAGATNAIKWTKASINASLRAIAGVVVDLASQFEQATLMTNDNRRGLRGLPRQGATRLRRHLTSRDEVNECRLRQCSPRWGVTRNRR